MSGGVGGEYFGGDIAVGRGDGQCDCQAGQGAAVIRERRQLAGQINGAAVKDGLAGEHQGGGGERFVVEIGGHG